MVRFHFPVVVWGEAFTELYLNASLPSELAPGNLPDVPNIADCRYRYFTTERDAERIRRSPLFERLSGLLPVEFVSIEDILRDHGQARQRNAKYEAFSACQRQALQDANDDDAAFAAICPDSVRSEGLFRRMAEIMNAGKRAIMIPVFRVELEPVLPLLLERYVDGDTGIMSVPPRDLVKLAVSHIHVGSAVNFWDRRRLCSRPDELYWCVGESDLLCYSTGYTPLAVYPREKNVTFDVTFDYDLVEKVCRDFGDIHVVSDSDELFETELCAADFEYDRESWSPSKTWKVAWFLARKADTSRRRYFFEYPIRFHSGDLSDVWKPVEVKAAVVLNRIRKMLSFILVLQRLKLLAAYDGVVQALRLAYRRSGLRRLRHAARRLRTRRNNLAHGNVPSQDVSSQ
ncbi:MAG: hypothetical protein ACE5KM_09815 [Planctomycetaceae bacterium]